MPLFFLQFVGTTDHFFLHDKFGFLINRAAQLDVAVVVYKLFLAVTMPYMDPIFGAFVICTVQEGEIAVLLIGTAVIGMSAGWPCQCRAHPGVALRRYRGDFGLRIA